MRSKSACKSSSFKKRISTLTSDFCPTGEISPAPILNVDEEGENFNGSK